MRNIAKNSAMAAIGLLFLATSAAFSQDAGKGDMAGLKRAAMTGKSDPQEGGQAAVAAIWEIVASLESNPKTDWSKVNIEALRQHLIDLNNVTMEDVVVSTQGGKSTPLRWPESGAKGDHQADDCFACRHNERR